MPLKVAIKAIMCWYLLPILFLRDLLTAAAGLSLRYISADSWYQLAVSFVQLKVAIKAILCWYLLPILFYVI